MRKTITGTALAVIGSAVLLAGCGSDDSTGSNVEPSTSANKAQGPEIERMRGWLTRWGAGKASSMPGMRHGGTHGMEHGSMRGMMSGEDMGMLRDASGTGFDRLWLEMMVEHHRSAVEMSRTELSKGSNQDAKALAQRIIDTQQAEITEMRRLLKSR